MFCNACGQRIEDGERFCKYCGTPAVDPATFQKGQPPQTPNAQPPVFPPQMNVAGQWQPMPARPYPPQPGYPPYPMQPPVGPAPGYPPVQAPVNPMPPVYPPYPPAQTAYPPYPVQPPMYQPPYPPVPPYSRPPVGYGPYMPPMYPPRGEPIIQGPAPHENWEPEAPEGKKGKAIVPISIMGGLAILGVTLFFCL